MAKNNAKKKEVKLLKEKEVTLKNGKTCPESEAIMIGEYYFSKKDSDIVFDFIREEWTFKKNCREFITALDSLGNKNRDTAKYTSNNQTFYNAIRAVDSNYNEFVVEDFQFLKAAGYVECLVTGIFYHEKLKKEAKTTKTGNYRKVNAIKKVDKHYDSEDKNAKYQFGVDSPTYSISEGKRYTMGFELETCRGFIPVRYDSILNYSAVHDGSLREPDGSGPFGGEYVTGVLKGDMGFRQLKLLCTVLSERCSIDKRCGVHVHLGGIDFSKEFVVHMYYLSKKLEAEIASMLPNSRRNNEYCKKLKPLGINLNKLNESSFDYTEQIEEFYNKILLYVAHQDELDPVIMNKKKNHPMGEKCEYNHATARYDWINFVPTLFNTRGNESYTVEIRNMNGSLNYLKIRNWALIFMAMVNVADNHRDFIQKTKDITLEDILTLSYPRKCRELIKYVQIRKDKFAKESAAQEKEEYLEENEDKLMSLKSL